MLPLVVANPHTDGALPLARRRLDDAVSSLADPQPVACNGAYRWAPALYAGMRGALRGSSEHRTGVFRSVLPCRLDVLGWLIEVDRVVSSWEPDKGGTVERLHLLAGRGWRPQDCAIIACYTDRIEGWVLVAADMLHGTPKVHLEAPCPACGARWAYRREGCESVRARALRVSEDGCVCQGCGAFWPPDRFEWLARLLGCPSLPT